MLGPIFNEPHPVSSGYGMRKHPISGEEHFHNGIDFAVPVGTQIISPLNGVVSFVGTDALNGSYILLENDDYTVSFAHLLSPMKFAGEYVGEGDPVALSGSSGRSTGPHVHVRVKNSVGETIDPTDLFGGHGEGVGLVAGAIIAGVLL